MEPFGWEISVPLFRNRFILKDLGLAVGIPFGTLIAFIVIGSGGDILQGDAKYALLLIGLLFFLTWLLLMLVYRGRYLHGFRLDNTGVRFYTPPAQHKKNRGLQTTLLVLSVLSAKPTAAGAAMIAQSRENVFIPWNKLRKVRFYEGQCAILLRGGLTEKLVMFCGNADIYAQATAIVRAHAAALCGESPIRP